MADFNDGLLGSFEVAKEIGISLERLRYWERAGIIAPRYVECGTRRFRRYSQKDMYRARMIKVLVDEEKYSLGGAIRKLDGRSEEQLELDFQHYSVAQKGGVT